MSADYLEVRQWLELFIPHTWTRKELGLGRIKQLLKLLGNPQNKFKSIHVAGTSGKGSTAFSIAKLLQESGKSEIRNPKSETNSNFQNSNHKTFSNFDIRASNFPMKVGLHISPHLVDIRERMQIFQGQRSKVKGQRYDENLLPLNHFVGLFNQIKPIVENIKATRPDLTPSYFEILVAASFLYFAQEKVDWAVVEVGLGGRLDATNVLNPALTVVTNVGLDHTDILGRTEEKIAFEKAGIIKLNVPIVTGASGKALEVLEKVAKEKNALLIKVGTQSSENALKSEVFNINNLPIDIFRSTSYSFAFSNKLLALVAVKTLGIPLGKGQIAKAFGSTFPGRFEEIEKGVILDGAHNADKVRFLIRLIKEKTTDYRLQTTSVDRRQWTVVLIIAFKKGKDWKKMVDLLIKNLPVSKVIATRFHAVTDMGKHQAVDPKEIAKHVRSVYRLPTTVYSNSQEAVFEALKRNNEATKQRNIVLITGSMYLVGEVRTVWYLPEF